ncbi:cupin domain-containing protein [Paenibacillus psychroresistens]|uniref:Cupin domain-containing protein n=1 Tax=Paenibacillus psychroresistens TaxID=1778678 RepID=A0A6B8RDK7_9BACL|nr:cupin domain-containing protein [Paenibacillus psychroresistens]QGQ94289.1 cupin domain-containing protein [Paenibacillus psychroresistens]
MGKGTVIKSAEVQTLYVDKTYSSKMLLDQTNSETKGIQINQGFISPGSKHADHYHHVDYDEVYLIMKGEAKVRLDGVETDLAAGDVVHIPGGTMHAIENKSDTEELVIFTAWSRHPEQGINPVYDMRVKAWGKSYKTIDEE